MIFDITPIIGAILALLGAVITYILVPWIKSKTTTEQQAMINYWVTVAVQAAEMLHKEGSGRGEEKREYVIAFLKEKGFTVDETELRVMIEAAVLELKNGLV